MIAFSVAQGRMAAATFACPGGNSRPCPRACPGRRSGRPRSWPRFPRASSPRRRSGPAAPCPCPARPAPRPSRGPGRSGCPGCRSGRPCGRGICCCPGTWRWPNRASRPGPWPSRSRRRGQVLERGGEGRELAQRIPAQVVFLLELLDVLGGRAAGARLEQPAAGQQRHDGQHLGARPDLKDREEVGQVIAQDVAGHRDRVQALADPLQRVLHRLDRGQDLDLQAGACRGSSGTSRPWR